jgi:hypothetical protein
LNNLREEERAQMTDTQLMERILSEIARVWGDDDGLAGEAAEYAWLHAHYGITEEEDARWHLLLQENMGELSEEDEADPEIEAFLEDGEAVTAFLEMFLAKYQSSDVVYPG